MQKKKQCPNHQRFRGLDSSGNPICKAVQCICNINANLGCGSGGWIEAVTIKEFPNTLLSKVSNSVAPYSCGSLNCIMDKNGGACLSNKGQLPPVFCNTKIKCCYEIMTAAIASSDYKTQTVAAQAGSGAGNLCNP